MWDVSPALCPFHPLSVASTKTHHLAPSRNPHTPFIGDGANFTFFSPFLMTSLPQFIYPQVIKPLYQHRYAPRTACSVTLSMACPHFCRRQRLVAYFQRPPGRPWTACVGTYALSGMFRQLE